MGTEIEVIQLSQEMPRTVRSHQRLEKEIRILPWNFQKEHSLAYTLILDSQSPEVWRINLFFLSHLFCGNLYGIPIKPI